MQDRSSFLVRTVHHVKMSEPKKDARARDRDTEQRVLEKCAKVVGDG